MREIIFRGKRVDNGEWVYGYYDVFRYHEDAPPIYLIHTNGWTNSVEIEPGTVGQYTGMTDKNDKKIFEGDIVRYRPGYWRNLMQSVVEHCADKWNYPAFDLKDYDYEANGLQLRHMGQIELEVIGTIHDNPELLEVKK